MSHVQPVAHDLQSQASLDLKKGTKIRINEPRVRCGRQLCWNVFGVECASPAFPAGGRTVTVGYKTSRCISGSDERRYGHCPDSRRPLLGAIETFRV